MSLFSALLSQPPVLHFNNYAGMFNNTNAYFQLPSSSLLSFTDGSSTDTSFTIMAWIKAVRRGTFRIYSRSAGTNNMTMFFGGDANGLLTCVLYRNSTGNNINIAGPQVAGNRWQHVAVTYDGSEANTGFELYIDGVLQTVSRGSAGTYTGMNDYSDPVIGRFNVNGTTTYADGYIDEVGIFKGVAFNQTQINEAYGSGSVVDLTGHSQAANLSAYYRFENNANDSSGNALHATNNNVAFYQDIPFNILGNSDLAIMLAGQSNAKGNSNSQTLFTYLSTNPITGAEILELSGYTYQTLNIPGNNLSADNTCGAEGGSSFEFVPLKPTRKIVWGKFAVGSTPLWADPAKDDFNQSTGEYIVDLEAVAASLNTKCASLTNPKKIFVWIQGENDANDGISQATYETDFWDMFNEIETNITFDAVIIARLNSNIASAGFNTAGIPAIQAAQAAIVAADSRFMLLDMDNYTLGADAIHYTMVQNVRIGSDVLRMILKKLNLYQRK